jgi:hypothetical protein
MPAGVPINPISWNGCECTPSVVFAHGYSPFAQNPANACHGTPGKSTAAKRCRMSATVGYRFGPIGGNHVRMFGSLSRPHWIGLPSCSLVVGMSSSISSTSRRARS